ncbi:MAG TPA: hypothetical protein VF260_12050 [Bacilli bacterium]
MNEFAKSENEKYLSMAIQAVLHHHRSDIAKLNDERAIADLIQNMSEEILKVAQNFKNITDTAFITIGKKGLN